MLVSSKHVLSQFPAVAALVMLSGASFGASGCGDDAAAPDHAQEDSGQVVADAGEEGSIIVQKVKEGTGNFGFNAATGEYGDLVAQGVIDPVKVVRSALQNASSVASLMLTTECLVAERPKEEKAEAGGGHGHGHSHGF